MFEMDIVKLAASDGLVTAKLMVYSEPARVMAISEKLAHPSVNATVVFPVKVAFSWLAGPSTRVAVTCQGSVVVPRFVITAP